MSRFNSGLKAAAGFSLVIFLAGLALAADKKGYRAEREEFRKKIETKQEKEIPGRKDVLAVYFPEDAGKFKFTVKPEQAGKLREALSKFYELKDDPAQMIAHLEAGAILIGKRYSQTKDAGGVELKAVFMMPAVPYWKRLVNVDRIEDTFAVYNTSVEFGADEAGRYCFLQTEGTFFGMTRAVNLPVIFTANEAAREYSFRMPTQEQLNRVILSLAGGAADPEAAPAKFHELCRRHPLFAEKDAKDRFLISDKEIRKIYRKISDLKACDVKQTEGTWKIFEDFSGFYLVEYLLKSVVNIDAFVPRIPLVRGMVESAAQSISDEVSVKYLPLSMKNLRDWAVADQEKGKK